MHCCARVGHNVKLILRRMASSPDVIEKNKKIPKTLKLLDKICKIRDSQGHFASAKQIQRKIKGGSQSDWGLRFAEGLMTVSFTLKQRSGNSFNFLTRTFEARLKGDLAPSILDSS